MFSTPGNIDIGPYSQYSNLHLSTHMLKYATGLSVQFFWQK